MQPFEPLNEFVSRDQLAHALNVSTRSVARWEQQPGGLANVIIGGRKYYRRQAVMEWLAKREVKPNPRRDSRRAA